jgi:hypothetical protein
VSTFRCFSTGCTVIYCCADATSPPVVDLVSHGNPVVDVHMQFLKVEGPDTTLLSCEPLRACMQVCKRLLKEAGVSKPEGKRRAQALAELGRIYCEAQAPPELQQSQEQHMEQALKKLQDLYCGGAAAEEEEEYAAAATAAAGASSSGGQGGGYPFRPPGQGYSSASTEAPMGGGYPPRAPGSTAPSGGQQGGHSYS